LFSPILAGRLLAKTSSLKYFSLLQKSYLTSNTYTKCWDLIKIDAIWLKAYIYII
jgi:hypothetical protein